MRREIGYDVFAGDDPHEQAMPFPNMGNNPLIPILGSCRNWHQSGFPSGARQGTPSPWIAQTCPQPLSCALRAGNRLLHPLIANWDLAALRNVEGVGFLSEYAQRVPRLAALTVHFLFCSKGVASPALKSALAPPLDYIEGAEKTHSQINELAGGGASPAMTHPCVTSYDAPLRHPWQSIYTLCPIY